MARKTIDNYVKEGTDDQTEDEDKSEDERHVDPPLVKKTCMQTYL
jgi:hypothetical protein